MSNDVVNDFDALLEVSKGFMDYSEVLKGIDDFIEGALDKLKSDYFVGLIGTAALEAYVTAVRARLREVVASLINMSNDLDVVVADTKALQAERRRVYNEDQT